MKIEVTTQLKQSDVDEVRDGLRQHNTPYLSDIYHTDVACYFYDEAGNKIGGLIGEIWGQWLLVKFLWVDTQNLGQGIGSQLLVEAEEFTLNKGCKFSFLDTFSFQAKPFYEKQGYIVKMTLHDFPVESRRYYMTKKL